MSTLIDVEVDIEDHINEIPSDILMEELVERGFKVYKPGWSLTGDVLRRYLCDMVGLSYHTTNDELLIKVNESFK